jgi:hypothetical protein
MRTGSHSGHSPVDQFVILVHAEDAVRTEAFNGERAGDTDLLAVRVGFVIEIFKLSLGSNRSVDLFLSGKARL